MEARVESTAEELTERLLGDAVAAMETLNVYIGFRLGLYRALAGTARNAGELADVTGIHRRYAREWLEQQAVAGVLSTVDDDSDPYARRFLLPDAHREVLLDEDSTHYVGTLAGFVASIAAAMPHILGAFQTGGGVPYDAYGEGARHGIGGMNRPLFQAQLAGWIAAMPDIRARMTDGPARVLDLGCGTGWSSIAIAEAFPQVRVRGVDLDAASVADAERHAAARGLVERVRFDRADAAHIDEPDRFDLVCVFEALHDMADPVAVLRATRDLLAPGGAVLIADERVAERFTAPGDLVERLNYCFSVLHCLPATWAEGSVVEAGTVLRPDTVRAYAAEAGYGSCAELAIENDLWRFYRLDPA
jgi:SAM-dependent methyltransferase